MGRERRSGTVDSCRDLRRLRRQFAGVRELTIVCPLHDERRTSEGWYMGPCMYTPVDSGACAKFTMLEATQSGLLWLLFCPADVAVPGVLYGSLQGTRRFDTNSVVISPL